MWKNPSRGEAVMSDAALLGEATGWAKRLTRAEARGPGDIENAWRRLEARYGIPWRSFWALRYRPPQKQRPGLITLLWSRLRLFFARRSAGVRKRNPKKGLAAARKSRKAR
jgi:hypothetical protein